MPSATDQSGGRAKVQLWPVVTVGTNLTVQRATVVVELTTALVGLATALVGMYHTYRRLTRTESQ